MADPWVLCVIAATFLLAGAVKGVIGLGLPTVSLALLTVALGLPEAMNLLLVPSLVTNLWQGFVGGSTVLLCRRLWPFLLLAGLTVWLGAGALVQVDLAYLSALLGLLLIVYGLVSLLGLRFSVPASREVWAGPLVGLVNGLLTGMTGSFVVPGVMYLQALGLPRDQLIQAMGLLFSISTLALGLALGGRGLWSSDLGLLSLAALAPAILGMIAGQRLRSHLSETQFRKVFFTALVLLGGYILASALIT